MILLASPTRFSLMSRCADPPLVSDSTVAVLAPLITPECDIVPGRRHLGQGNSGGVEDEPNPSYRHDPCRWVRYGVLLGLNKWEAEMSMRVLMSIVMGSIIGFERCVTTPSSVLYHTRVEGSYHVARCHQAPRRPSSGHPDDGDGLPRLVRLHD